MEVKAFQRPSYNEDEVSVVTRKTLEIRDEGRKRIDELIVNIKNSKFLTEVRYPTMLVRALEDFRDLIGNDKVKVSVAKTLSDLIVTAERLGLDEMISSQMTHTVLYGPPGVGKTLIATKLAGIWYALGMLKRRSKRSKTSLDLMGDDLDGFGSGMLGNPIVLVFLGSTVIGILGWLFAKAQAAYSDPWNNKFNIFLLIGGSLLGGIFIYWMYSGFAKSEVDETKSDLPKNDGSTIKVVSREDLVGGYVGQSCIKTKAVLESAVGKVLVIDEAYTILPNGGYTNDQFGMEVLDVINRFMSERAGEIIIVFCGYKNEIKRLFDAQKGLERRFLWKFDCDGYTPSQLFQIFKIQAKKLGYKIHDEKETEAIFLENPSSFPNFGGDTENLLTFTKMEHSDDFIRGSEINISTIYPIHVRKAMVKMAENVY